MKLWESCRWLSLFFFSSRRRHTRLQGDWSSDVCSSDLSEETPINCHAFTELLAQCELPAGVFNVVYGQGGTGAALAGHAGVDMVSFTGSVEIGRASCRERV